MKTFELKYGRKQETDNEKEENVILLVESEDEDFGSFQQETEATEMEKNKRKVSYDRLERICSVQRSTGACAQFLMTGIQNFQSWVLRHDKAQVHSGISFGRNNDSQVLKKCSKEGIEGGLKRRLVIYIYTFA
ncbi:hypothetical protein AVEN_200199-1 [Araneus ventricosus]|uniref:Uncharacterized protein n=1 Tax=Araneus ventricosus TaxID=182803 RepID=A0A4Y2URV9_ARAVE|nr:hypothetical protein AVEN_248614-1 [Araneus ventricosus]GBO14436.1 hypothetical protein AVEN_200199-1 [Araneus ventricosus]